MDEQYGVAQCVTDVFGAIYRNLIRDEGDGIAENQNTQSALLSVLLRNGPTKMSAISKHLRVSKPNITFLVDKLEGQKLICRQHDKTDRRIMNIELTEKGRRMIEKQKLELLKKVKSRLELLSEDDLQVLRESFTASLAILRKIYKPNDRMDEGEQA